MALHHYIIVSLENGTLGMLQNLIKMRKCLQFVFYILRIYV